MSQNDMTIADDTFANVRTDINSALGALVSLSSGASEPSTPFAYQLWADTTTGYLKQRNAANNAWITKWALADTMGNVITRNVGTAASSIIALDGSAKLPAVDASQLTALPFDIAFCAGLQTDGTFADVAVQNYGELVVARSLTIVGEQLYMDTAPTGQAAIFDIKKNGTTIYSTKPQCAASANTGTAGTLSTTTLAAGDRVTFLCTQRGSGTYGKGVRFTLKSKLA
jgi:hypothetical protein